MRKIILVVFISLFYTFLAVSQADIGSINKLPLDSILKKFTNSAYVKKEYYDDGGIKMLWHVRDNKLNGRVIWFYPDQKVKNIGKYSNAALEGDYFSFDSMGVIRFHGAYKKGLTNGRCTWYYPDGKTESSINYLFGKQDKESLYYYENGQLYESMFYKNGKLHGAVKRYYSDGKLACEAEFNKGRLGPRLYYDSLGNPANGQHLFYKDGLLGIRAICNNGKPEGIVYGYYKNGSKAFLSEFNNGIPEGLHIVYDENGTVILAEIYKNGKRIKQQIEQTPEKQINSKH